MPAAAHLVGLNSDELVPSEDEASLNPFFNVGQRKIHDMLAFALEDRLVSKRRIKNLQDIAGAPGQARARQLWFNYFKAFITDVMGHDKLSAISCQSDLRLTPFPLASNKHLQARSFAASLHTS